MRSQYGKRGGTSATAGKKKSVYEGTAPDGSILHVGSFHVSADKAWMHISNHKGTCWYGNGVRPAPEEWGAAPDTIAQWIECSKVK